MKKIKSKFWKILSREREEIRRRLEKEKDSKVKIVAKGHSIEKAAKLVGMKMRMAYIWVNQWIKNGYDGLLPKKRSGRPPKLNKEQKEKMKEMLKQKD